jgi:subtilase family serine protease
MDATRCSLCALLLAVGLTPVGAKPTAAAEAAPRLITERSDERSTVTLHGCVRPEANERNDRGRVSDSLVLDHMQLQLRRPYEREQSLETLIDQLHTPGSPQFHHWLKPKQFGDQFGASTADTDAVTNWLTRHGFTVNQVYPNQMVIDFTGTARQVRDTFHTEIHHLLVNGEQHFANMADPQIPAALAPAIVGVVSMHDFRPRSMFRRRAQHWMGKQFTFTQQGTTFEAVVPADLATIYNLNPLFAAGYSGQGQTVAVIEDTNVYSTKDWTTFRSTFGLSSYTSGSFTQVHPTSDSDNCTNPGDVTASDAEAILDAEWASAAAPSAKIELASCADTNTTFGGLIALENLLNGTSTPPAIVSISYGECEVLNGTAANAAYFSAYQQAAAEGVSVFVSAGDDGAASCDDGDTQATHGIGVSGFASTPYNVAVGGTDFGDTFARTNSTYWGSTNAATFGSALSYVPEIPWNDSCASGLLSSYMGFATPYGSTGFCNNTTNTTGQANFLTTTAGSGGPSSCASGGPSVAGVVSGTCQGNPKPAWQSGLLGNPADGVRDLPDISLFASNGVFGHFYIVCYSNTAGEGAACTGSPSAWTSAGGTSFAAPILAGIQALVNQHTGERWGNPNPTYYSMARAEYGSSGSAACNSVNGRAIGTSCVFYDITQGDIDVDCTGSDNCYLPSGTNGVLSTSGNAYNPAYGAGTGWDFATGIGSINAYNFVMSWPTGQATTAHR